MRAKMPNAGTQPRRAGDSSQSGTSRQTRGAPRRWLLQVREPADAVDTDLHSVFYGCLMIKNCCFAVPTGLVDEKLPLASNVPLVSTSQLPNGVVRLVVVRTW